MATETISQLPLLSGLSGQELFIVSAPSAPPVPYTSAACTTTTIKNFIAGVIVSVTMRQLLAALQNQGVFFTAFNQLPSDPSNQYNIAWFHAYYITPSDQFITGFLQPALSYSSTQITNLFVLAASFPS